MENHIRDIFEKHIFEFQDIIDRSSFSQIEFEEELHILCDKLASNFILEISTGMDFEQHFQVLSEIFFKEIYYLLLEINKNSFIN